MKDNVSNAEIFMPFADYNKIESKKENWIKSVILIITALILEALLFLYYFKVLNKDEFIDFITEYINTEIDIIVLLLSFSIAYLTILISSEGHTICKLKEYKTEIIIEENKISLYQILLIQLTYTIYSEIVLLFILLINKFMTPVLTILLEIVFFIVSIIILLNIMYITFKNVKNIYLSFWK